MCACACVCARIVFKVHSDAIVSMEEQNVISANIARYNVILGFRIVKYHPPYKVLL